MYKLLATDIDGTLINSKRELTDNTKKAIYEAYDKGCVILPCSGRGPLPLQDITNAVSYTHLDVYKRQIITPCISSKVLFSCSINKYIIIFIAESVILSNFIKVSRY